MDEKPTIFLVDDDSAVRESLSMALDLAGYRVQAYATAESFFETCSDGDRPGCLILDLRMPGMDGLSLQEALRKKGCQIPVIFISGAGSIPASVKAVQQGAVDFLEKPLSTATLISRIEKAVAEDRRQREREMAESQIRARCQQLTPRECEVMQLATDGLSNKEIARVLNISPRTVENHRAHVMEKMQAANIADLCRKAALCHELGIEPDMSPGYEFFRT